MRVAHADFETKSEAGFAWDEATNKWRCLPGAPQGRKGLSVVGAPVYAEHPTTDVLTLSYKLPGRGLRRWRPGMQLPVDLFDFLATGGRLKAHNVMFERLIWERVCVPRYGFPSLDPGALECSMATAHVNCLPGSLENLGDVLQLSVRKLADGRRLLNKFSIPRNPTKGDPRRWIEPADDPDDAERLYGYCDQDVDTEEAASTHPRNKPMTAEERAFWLIDQEINWRGIAIDRAAVRDCAAILAQALAKYEQECIAITGGIGPSQVQALSGWMLGRGVYTSSLDADSLDALLERQHPPLPPDVRRVVEIRQLAGSASVKKLYAMENMACADDRLRDLIVHHGARTGRPTGSGPQPLNLPRSGPKLLTCGTCARPFAKRHTACPWCGGQADGKGAKWNAGMVDACLSIIASRSLELVEWYFADALGVIAGCLRGLFVAGPGMDLVSSDYSAIEAVVTAMLAGEQWRVDAFHAKTDIYLASASKITGTTVEQYAEYLAEHGDNHPDRQLIGKVAELALGFGGWIGAWRNFDDSDTFTDDQVKALILAWRDASPNIVELWGGQWRGRPWDGYAERYGLEGCAIDAIQNPGQSFTPRLKRADGSWRYLDGVAMFMRGDALIIRLLSGRELTYHEPRLHPSDRPYSRPGELSISYSTWNSNPTMGPLGWIRMSTYGARLCENVVQATAHCLLRFAIINLRAAGFPTVLAPYDEIVSEIPETTGEWALAEFERIMSLTPEWARGWPVRASGGWRGKRYRKG